jgi:chromosome segregation ATPase
MVKESKSDDSISRASRKKKTEKHRSSEVDGEADQHSDIEVSAHYRSIADLSDDDLNSSIVSATKKSKSKTKKSSKSSSTSLSSLGESKELNKTKKKKKTKEKKAGSGDELEDTDYYDEEGEDESVASQSVRSSRSRAPKLKRDTGTDDDASVHSRHSTRGKRSSITTTTRSNSLNDASDGHFMMHVQSPKPYTTRRGLDDDEAKEDSVKTKSKRSKSSSTTSDPKTKKKTKKKESSTAENNEADYDDDGDSTASRSVRSSRSRQTKPKKDKGIDNDDSVRSRSIRSKRTSSSKIVAIDEHVKTHLKSPRPYTGHRGLSDNDEEMQHLKADNEALVAESVALRKQLRDVLTARPTEMAQLSMDLKRCQNEVSELKTEIGEYEEAVAEKDDLIKKLTEAVDAQLDKVEILEVKLQRAEQEFCTMEDELKELEDEIYILKGKNDNIHSVSKGAVSRGSHDSFSDASDSSFRHVEVAVDQSVFDEEKSRLERKEAELEQRESALYRREQSISSREDEMFDRAEQNLRDEMDKVRMKELRLNERERQLMALEEQLKERETEMDERPLAAAVPESPGARGLSATDDDEISNLKSKIMGLESQLSELQREGDSSKVIAELKERLDESQVALRAIQEENMMLQKKEVDRISQERERDLEREIEMQAILEGNNKQLQELYEENRLLQTEVTVMKEQNETLKQSIPEEGVDPMDHAMASLQDEIAGLREKIVEKELEVKTRNEVIAQLTVDSEERDNETKEMQAELVSLEAQLKDTKATTNKKMSQKDETIAFMQNEMVRIMKEKSEIERKVLGRGRDAKEVPARALGASVKHETAEMDEAAERAKIQAFNDQLAKLDDANQKLVEELKQVRYQHGIQLKEKEARILEIEEVVADLNWEMKARKEADYVSLLQDRKERKTELDQLKKELKKSEDRAGDLIREIDRLKQQQVDLENDIDELNKSLVSRDSGDYVTGLKRQIRSLKEHNTTLERKIEIETANKKEVIAKKDAKLVALKKEVRDLKHPGNAVVRGMLAFATGNSEDSIASESSHSHRRNSNHSRTDKDRKEPRQDTKRSSLWSAIRSPFGQKKSASAVMSDKDVGMPSFPEDVVEDHGLTNAKDEKITALVDAPVVVSDDCPKEVTNGTVQ